MRIDLKRLQHLVVLGRVQHFGRAAEEIGITQPALSKSLRILETELGLRLFERGRWGVRITQAGQAVLERADMLVNEADDFMRYVARIGDSRGGRIAFGMAPLPSHVLLADVLQRASVDMAEYSYRSVTRNASTMLEMLLERQIEFFVALEGQLPLDSSVRSETLGAFPVCLLVRKAHPILHGAGKDRTYPVLSASSMAMPTNMADVLDKYASGTSIVSEDYAALTSLTLSSDGIWLSSSFAATAEIRSGELVELPTVGDGKSVATNVGFYRLARLRLSPPALWLRSALQDLISTLNRTTNRCVEAP